MCFFYKEKSDYDKNFHLYDRFFVTNQNFTTKHVKIGKIPDFLVIFIQNSRFFFKISPIPGFQVKWQPCLNQGRQNAAREHGFILNGMQPMKSKTCGQQTWLAEKKT